MNLFDMANRKDEILRITDKVTLAKLKLPSGDEWRALRVQADDKPQISVSEVIRWYPFSTRAETIGWYARTDRGEASLDVQLMVGDLIISTTTIPINHDPKTVSIPWPLSHIAINPATSLVMRFNLLKGQNADLMINRCLNRSDLTSIAKGNGIEVGPGPKPQIINREGVHVKYVEEMSSGEWKHLYDKGGQYESDSADWSNHIVGKAAALPCEDESLDFIFSSHVFEHLANPIGHLAHWASKLKVGGVILSVVPDIAGTKDYRHKPSSLEEMLAEYKDDIWEPSAMHYERWASTRGNWEGRVKEAIEEKRSIHVHFYTRENTAALLDYAVSKLSFESFHIKHTPNHRDFYWILIKR
ncbi:methyltransferase domain-containing protein [Pseudomonas frederiksbergensis]|uniref:methyltransferase domain-containing protein n=1 Tax=Pseudomonas frederiksbergensis TaxID=104087 RepID=UPI002DB59D6F|nr:methyltransferase domain-containing protein [Pseudomonas frederiksbergensis]WRV66843.1 methyltransferase domain-containing protein [Pseudomonas frederiksbergensis]